LSAPRAAGTRIVLAPGVDALAPGVAFLRSSRTLVATDTHFGYEEAIGGALPAWSTYETVAKLLAAISTTEARELVVLGDVVHAPRSSEGVARIVAQALQTLRERCRLTLIAGNHEGRSGAQMLLGETHRAVERDGWTLAHGDRPTLSPRTIIGHLHPSVHLSGGVTIPAFLCGPRLIVVPALTPYSSGLDVTSPEMLHAASAFGVRSRAELDVVAVGEDRLYPFGELGAFCEIVRGAGARPAPFRRKVLRPDR
jgi:hypothetical protein